MIEYIKTYVWPDGTECDEEDLEEFLKFMSDDYAIILIKAREDLDQEGKQ